MSQGLRELQPYDLTRELETVLLPRLVHHLRSKAPGHCMRLSDLDHELMVQLCGRLRAEVDQAEVVILDAGQNGSIPPEFGVSSTKLVELRNPLTDGTQRPPLLVFIPHDLRAAAEDSFGVATFEEIQLGDIYADLRDALLADLPSHLRSVLGESIRQLTDADEP